MQCSKIGDNFSVWKQIELFYRPVVRKTLHDGLSCRSMRVIDADALSKNKSMRHAKDFL